jgi:hypothetical protein
MDRNRPGKYSLLQLLHAHSPQITNSMAPEGDKLNWNMDPDMKLAAAKVLKNEREAGHQAQTILKSLQVLRKKSRFGRDAVSQLITVEESTWDALFEASRALAFCSLLTVNFLLRLTRLLLPCPPLSVSSPVNFKAIRRNKENMQYRRFKMMPISAIEMKHPLLLLSQTKPSMLTLSLA